MDIVSLIQASLSNAWVYLPLAVLLGALHALEPGHSKSLMAGFIIANKGTAFQAVLLGVSAAIAHSLIVFILAVLGLWLNERFILEKSLPYLHLFSGCLILILAAQMLGWIHFGHAHHHHGHNHHHDHDHSHDHHHATPLSHAQTTTLSHKQALWFGFSGGLMPCPAAITVLMICLQIKAFALGIGMVFAFSLGLAMTLVSVGLIAVYGTRLLQQKGAFSAFGEKIPLIIGGIMLCIGFFFIFKAVTEF